MLLTSSNVFALSDIAKLWDNEKRQKLDMSKTSTGSQFTFELQPGTDSFNSSLL